MSDQRPISTPLWNNTSIRWKLAEMVRHGKSRQEKRIYQLLLDMRLMQEPLPSLLDMISRELRRQTSTEGADFLRKVQDFVFQVDFPSQYSALFVRFLEQNAYLMQNEHD